MPASEEQRKAILERMRDRAARQAAPQIPEIAALPVKDQRDILVKQLARGFFEGLKNEGTVSRFSKVMKLFGAGAVANLSAPSLETQQVAFRALQGQSLGENLKRFGHDVINTPLSSEIIALSPSALLPTILTGKLPPEDVIKTASRLMFPERIDFHESLKTSTDSLRETMGFINPMGQQVSQARIEEFMAETGEQDPTVGQFVTWQDAQFRARVQEASQALSRRLGKTAKLPVFVPGVMGGSRFTSLDNIIKKGTEGILKFGQFYWLGDILYGDPFLYDALAGGPAMNLATKTFLKGLEKGYGLVGRGALAASRGEEAASRFVSAQARSLLKTGRFARPVDVGDLGSKTVTRVWMPPARVDSPGRMTSEALRFKFEPNAPRLPAGISAIESRDRALRQIFSDIGKQHSLLKQQAKLEEALLASRRFHHTRLDPAVRLMEGKIPPEELGKIPLATEDVTLLPPREVGMLARQELISEVERGLKKYPTGVLPRNQVTPFQEVPEFLQIEGTDLLTIPAGSRAIKSLGELFEGKMDSFTKKPILQGDGKFRVFTSGKTFEEALASRVVLRRPSPDNVIVEHSLEPGKGKPFEAVGVYLRTPSFDHQLVAFQGGKPPTFLKDIEVKGIEEAVQKRLDRLRGGTPLYHHTLRSSALQILSSGKIEAKSSPFPGREVPSVSFTRQDAANLLSEEGHALSLTGEGPQLEPPTTQESFNEVFGPVRLVTTREELTRKLGKPQSFHFSRSRGKSEVFEAEERLFKDVPLDAILRIDIDPGALSKFHPIVGENLEGAQVEHLLRVAEAQGIPVYIKPLSRGAEVLEFRPLERRFFSRSQEPKQFPVRFLTTEEGGLSPQAIQRIDIDPSALTLDNPEFKEAAYEKISQLLNMAHEKDIPVFIRPLFQQNEIEVLRPFVDTSVINDKLVKGPDSVNQFTKALTSVATAQPYRDADFVMTSADVAAHNLDFINTFMAGDAPGKAIEEVIPVRFRPLSPDVIEQLQKSYLKLTTGEDNPLFRKALPEVDLSWMSFGGPPPLSGKKFGVFPKLKKVGVPPHKTPYPPVDGLLPEFTIKRYRDIGIWGSTIDEPVDALGTLDHPNANQVLMRWDRADFESRMFLQEITDLTAPLMDLIRRDPAADRYIFDLLDTHPDRPLFPVSFKALIPAQKSAFRRGRAGLHRGWIALKEAGVAAGEEPKFLRGYGPHVFDRIDDWQALIDLLGQDTVDGNAILNHLKNRFGVEGYKHSVTQSFRAYFTAVARKRYFEPAWKDMLSLADDLPPNARAYVQDWVKALKGRPATFEATVRAYLAQARNLDAPAREKFLAAMADGGARLTMAFTHLAYKGALLGNSHLWLQNFLTQGVLNPAADAGPFWMMKGWARFLDAAWRKQIPQAPLMGGFQALFEDLPLDIPAGKKAIEVAQRLRLDKQAARGITALSRTLKTLERTIGVTQVETQMRGMAWMIGAGQELERIEGLRKLPHGSLQRPEVFTDGSLTPKEVRDVMLAGVRTSNNWNFQYGVVGSNPRLRQIAGKKLIGTLMQFQSFYGKELGWIARRSGIRGGGKGRATDPGLVLRGWELMGVLDRLLDQAGIDSEEFNVGRSTLEIPERFARSGTLPAGVAVNAMALAIKAQNTEDPIKAEQAWKDFFRSSGLAVPGILGIRRALLLREQADMQTRISPYSQETLRRMKPEEIPVLLFGAKTVSDKREQEIHHLAWRMERENTRRMQRMASDWLQAHFDGDQETMARIEQESKKFGIDFAPSVESRLKRLAYARLFRDIESMNSSIGSGIIVEQIRRDFPQLFSEEQTLRLQRELNRVQERQQ